MTEPARDACTVVRAPGAPPRRAGRVWPVGETDADLTGAQMAVIDTDPGYRLVLPDGHARNFNVLDAEPKHELTLPANLADDQVQGLVNANPAKSAGRRPKR